MNLYIDFGGTNLRYCFDDSKILSINSINLDFKDFLDKQILENDIKSISISFAGVVKDGVILSSPNIGLENFDIKSYIEDRYNIVLKIDNDLNCAIRAEFKYQPKIKSIAVLYIGTGFGGAFIDNGNVIKGANNIAGEIGHIPFKTTPFRCGCGRFDCLELSTSGDSIKKWCKYYNIKLKNYTLDELENYNTSESNLILDNFYKGLAFSFNVTLNMLEPDCFILGGSVFKNNPKLKDFLENQFKEVSFQNIRKKLIIEISKLDNGALDGTKLL